MRCGPQRVKPVSSPGVIYGLPTGISLLGVQLHQVSDEVLGRVGDVVPVGGVKLVVSPHDLLEQLRVVLVVERRIAAEPVGRERRVKPQER